MAESANNPPRISARGRRAARRLTVQALYQQELAEHSIKQLIGQYRSTANKGSDLAYFERLLAGIMGKTAQLQAQLQPLLDRDWAQLDPIEKAVLLVGAFELIECLDVPYRVVINEAVELAKAFGAEDSHKYVNGVLDRLAVTARDIEIKKR